MSFLIKFYELGHLKGVKVSFEGHTFRVSLATKMFEPTMFIGSFFRVNNLMIFFFEYLDMHYHILLAIFIKVRVFFKIVVIEILSGFVVISII
ncbi:hypothetical protein HanRHA438_Chr09g0421931 [Helianthus annuus]|nr:hypothetical protein HanRHA438_Chr09g0421931 [Helianthus annuus]